MRYVVDSGSTQSTWESIDGHCKISIAGLNPLTTSEEQRSIILEIVKKRLLEEGSVDAIFFYGAGCGSETGKQLIKESLTKAFGDIEVEAEGDLLGACRALLGHSTGYAGILGTGSNACHYDGSSIDRKICSMGYLLGDEGSGNHIGRLLTKDFLSGKMPKELSLIFQDNYCYRKTKEEMVAELYGDPMVNRFFGSMTYFASHFRDNEYIINILQHSFTEYFNNQVIPILKDGDARSISLTGSVAWFFSDEIKKAAKKADITLDRITLGPADGLVDFHRTDSKKS